MKSIKSRFRAIDGFRMSNGFALVITLLLLVLLSLLCVGMLSLSTISLRSSVADSDMSKARSNARMALMLAIGQLQDQLGPDQRVSANSEILSDPTANHPHWTGVWDSWKAGSDTSGDDQPSDHSTIPDVPGARNGMNPTYEEGREDHFRAWLVSLDPGEEKEISSATSLALDGAAMPAKTDTAVHLVGEGSLADGDTTGYVSARLLPVETSPGKGSGRYAWWVGDESQKASILPDPYNSETSLTDADHIFRSQAPGAMGTKVIQGLQNSTDEKQFDNLPTLKTLDLVDVDPAPTAGSPTISQNNFHHVTTYNLGVLADVREGGLKRDLSTILEREIKLEEDGDEFMLYRFDDEGEERVPIQDLSAYYQLYDKDASWEFPGNVGGVEHNVAPSRVMQVNVPDYGGDNDRDKYLRQYTSLYRSPVPIKVQFVLGVGATAITDAERTAIVARGIPLRTSDKYKLLLGVKPVVSLWNPNNLPLVMGTNASQIMKVSFPPFALRWKKYRAEGGPDEYQGNYLNLNYSISNESTGDGRARSLGPYIMQLQFAKNSPIVFQPGEVKQFSIPINADNFLESGGNSMFGNTPLYQAEEFFPDGFYVTAKTVVQSSGADAVQFPNSAGTFLGYQGWRMPFGDGDSIDMEVVPEAQSPRSRAISNANEVRGSAFHFWMSDASFSTNRSSHFRNYQFISRFGGTDNPNSSPNFEFNSKLMLSGFPDGVPIPYEGKTNAVPGSTILAATQNGEAKALLNFFMMAGCETNNSSAGGAGAGRRITTRAFTHGSSLSAPQITGNEKSDLYDYGWEWQVNKINSLEEAFQDDGNGGGFYGGGYTAENGATHVVQQYLPVLPPISIASLSSAHLGGFSLAYNAVMSSPTSDVTVGSPYGSGDIIRDAPNPGDFRQVTATGQGGLAPHTLQAIGNSHAHPNIPPDKAYTSYVQLLNMDTDASSAPEKTYADHSYLANKALWDEFFFSSITPQPSDIPLYGGSDRTALDVANDFLANDGLLPNRRFVPYTSNLDTGDLEDLEAEYTTYENGFADKIASHLMVSGPFNINSTSVEAWKVFFSSLKGKPLSYLENQASSLTSVTPDGTPVTPGLANGEPIHGADLSGDANAPPEQWTSPRVLSDQEIDELAVAMVKQVRKRGPFLSLSEFINRRLDGVNEELALKGALQAALDDESVSINAAFRTPERSMDGEIGTMSAAFPEALNGPIAYGSTPYVDQADILRHMGSLLTPRGDTFVIRTYGDSLDSKGNVLARAWCEAVVQRYPDYVDNSDECQVKQESLTSPANKQYGRMFKIVRFRWLNANEV
jgi:hypothetical protein